MSQIVKETNHLVYNKSSDYGWKDFQESWSWKVFVHVLGGCGEAGKSVSCDVKEEWVRLTEGPGRRPSQAPTPV